LELVLKEREMKMNDDIIKSLVGLLFLIFALCFGLLLAFPIKWCWNYAIVDIFDLPTVTWGKAWCLYFLSRILIKSALIDIKTKGRQE